MTGYDPELERLRANIHCGALLERTAPPWRLDRTASTARSLKYRRGEGEILIVNHGGRGWWDPQSEAKGDVFDLMQHLDPQLNFGQVRRALRAFVNIAPTYPEVRSIHPRGKINVAIAKKWDMRPPLKLGSRVWRYLNRERALPEAILAAAGAADVVREGPYGSAWFAHRDAAGTVTHIEVRGPDFKGSLAGGSKTLFRFSHGSPPPMRFVLAEAPIDALSIASLEYLRPDTLYAATGGGTGPRTHHEIGRLLGQMSESRNSVFCSAADANPAGERYAAHHCELAAAAGISFERLLPTIPDGDWNDVLRQVNAQKTRTRRMDYEGPHAPRRAESRAVARTKPLSAGKNRRWQNDAAYMGAAD
jgi:hypothetical protein